MSKLSTAALSSVGKKAVSGLTGIGLVGFIIVHLVGNLLLFRGPAAFNDYAHFLEAIGHGFLLPIAELGLAAFFIFHAVSGIWVALVDKPAARPQPYEVVANPGHTSRKTTASKTMIWSGMLLLLFLAIHLGQFRLTHGYTVLFGNEDEVFDLYRIVVQTFKEISWTAFYVVIMLLLGLHLRHGFWSMFQSLGLNNLRLSPAMFSLAVVVAGLLAVGFIVLPVYICWESNFMPNAALGGLR